MAIVTRYFSTSAAGDEDGTSWANRAALFDGSGNWSSIITGFNFSGSDALQCLIGPGSYSGSQPLADALFSNAPTIANNPLLHGCDSSGNKLTPPDLDWVSAQPDWDSSTLPAITGSVNNFIASYHSLRLIKMIGTTGTLHYNPVVLDWCALENAGTVVTATVRRIASNSIFKCTGSSQTNCISFSTGSAGCNIRVVGNPSATSGARAGVLQNFASAILFRVTSLNNVGDGFSLSSSSSICLQCVSVNNDGDGIDVGASTYCEITNCIVVTNGAYGIASSGTPVKVVNSRMRDNTSGNIRSSSTFPTDAGNDESAGTDAAEFVDSANGDYRIKASSAIWGKGYGAGDGPPTGGSATIAKDTSTKDAGDASIKMTGPGRYLLKIPVDASSTTISIKVRRESSTYDLGTRPSVVLIDKYGDANISGDTETETGSASCDDAWETLTFTAFTPSAKTWVFLELVSQTTASNGVCWFDTAAVS